MNVKQIINTIYPLQHYNVIIADGKFPTDKYLHNLLKNCKTLIACDGSVDILIKHNLKPNYIIGDCDSISNDAYKQFIDIITKDTNQNSNDLTKAINLALKLNLDNLIILGATGLREDHTIANISLLMTYQKQFTKIAMISDYGIFTVHNNNDVVITIKGQQISLFAPLYHTTLSIKELKWPLDNYTFELWHNGTLNEATANTMQINTNKSVIIYRAFCIKIYGDK